ncbi:hypothetical protein ACFSDD_00635 [Salipiger marinus]|uniref:hypothetical protein n=1 Tax=Salipiger marinus TaxID=555512 RepID=UPI001E3C9FCD|nr:hypothetical protein [Salipiger manganoxidans]MCD1620512.1 hypothetical protein [Salipiger manganoxidans]MEB3421420.1 hypothetical protein [Salipiger manganoxidans]
MSARLPDKELARKLDHRPSLVRREGQNPPRICRDHVIAHGTGEVSGPWKQHRQAVRLLQGEVVPGGSYAGKDHLVSAGAVNRQPPRLVQKAESVSAMKQLGRVVCALMPRRNEAMTSHLHQQLLPAGLSLLSPSREGSQFPHSMHVFSRSALKTLICFP